MPQENGLRSSRNSSRTTRARTNVDQNGNGTNKLYSNREVKERGYYSELATINPESEFQVNYNYI